MDLGMKRSNTDLPAAPKSEPKDVIDYPTITIEKPLGAYQVGDEFTATVKFKVRSITQGKEYSSQDVNHHRCTLEALSMDLPKSKKKGLPS